MKTLLAIIICCLNISCVYANSLIIGTSPFDPPMEMQATSNGVFTGFEIDLVNEICRRINANCTYRAMTFAGIMSAVAKGEVDLGIDGFFITEERKKYYLFSQPYLQTSAQLFSAADSDIDTTNINTGKRIGIEAGTVYKQILEAQYENIKLVAYNNQQEMLQDLVDHRIDLIMFDFISASYWVNSSQGVFKLVGEPVAFGNGYGILANINNASLMASVNIALNTMQRDGTYMAIYSRYF
ncbi:MAG: transporter substrate-binding domain-containing protein [Legionella sp.]